MGIVIITNTQERHPNGKLSEDDKGELDILIAADPDHQVVRIDFNKPVDWLAMPKQQALDFAACIHERANELPAAGQHEHATCDMRIYDNSRERMKSLLERAQKAEAELAIARAELASLRGEE